MTSNLRTVGIFYFIILLPIWFLGMWNNTRVHFVGWSYNNMVKVRIYRTSIIVAFVRTYEYVLPVIYSRISNT